MRVVILLLEISCLMGCSPWEGVQNDPVNHQKVVTAAAYGLDGCQSRMDELAHADVKMLEHNRQLMLTIFSFGYVPSYVCVGTAHDGSNLAAGHDHPYITGNQTTSLLISF